MYSNNSWALVEYSLKDTQKESMPYRWNNIFATSISQLS